jgi:metallophosphoesterase (TIGR00282 family)
MKILAIGDIFGHPGRDALAALLPRIISERKIDFVIVNGENAAGGRGVTPKVADELLKLPIDVMTAGNHIWEHDTLHPYFDTHPILRPVNIVEKLPGRGWLTKSAKGVNIAVVCLQGQIFMEEKGPAVSNPFRYMEALLPTLKEHSDLIVIDFHAEATSEKRALAWFLDGKVTALLGTHTHVQTADEEIMPGGTAYISDLGMTGPHASVIGLEAGTAIKRFLTGEKKHFKVAEENVRLEGVIMDVDERTRKATSIERVRVPYGAGQSA